MTKFAWTPLFFLTVALLGPACANPANIDRGITRDSDEAAEMSTVTRAPVAEQPISTKPDHLVETASAAPQKPVRDVAAGDLVSFSLGLVPGDMLYYVIESEFRESGGVPPLLSYSTTIKDRKTISQRVMPNTLRQATTQEAEDDPLMTILWKVERYEVTEQGMKDTLTYDSVRHIYPPPSLWELGTVAGAKVSFFIDPRNSRTESFNITPAKPAGETTRRPLSKIATKCQLNESNLTALLHDLGPYWMPVEPVAIGETWTREYTDDMKNFGKVATTLHCTLQSVKKLGDRRIARIELLGDVVLEPAPQPTTRPGQSPRANQQREFRIERSTCKGTVEFDLARGELYTLNLHRELHLTASVESERSGTMELKTGWAHLLKVRTGHTPPPKPLIVGGPKPPDVPPEDKPDRPTVRPPVPIVPKPSVGSTTQPDTP